MWREARRLLWPTEQQRSYRRFLAAGGDLALRYDYPLEGTAASLLDLGGYEGAWTAEMLQHYPGCESIVFEPVKTYADAIKHRFSSDGRVTVCAFALGATNRREEIVVDGDASSTRVRRGPSEIIEIVDVAEWWERSGPVSAAVAKINIEGGEYEVLPRLVETGLIRRIDHLQVQFHTFVPDAKRRMHRILRELAKTHEPTYRFPFVWENWRRRADSRSA
jgi:FkbM family methyltransferase